MQTTPDAGILTGGLQDFPEIYQDLIQQFPKSEQYAYEDFLRLLNGGEYTIVRYKPYAYREPVGYALVLTPHTGRVFWLDYLFIRRKYHSHGYGQTLFRAVLQKYSSAYDGMLLSVEHVSQTDPGQAGAQKRRIGFYEKLGAHRLHAAFLQPGPLGGFPMHLYFMPKDGCTELSRGAQELAIRQMYNYCCSQFPDTASLLPRFADTITDERFTG